MPALTLPVTQFIAAFQASSLQQWASASAWELTSQSEAVVRELLRSIKEAEYVIADEVAVHVSSIGEPGAVLKGPLILGPHCFVASGGYLRGGNWIADGLAILLR